MLFGPSHAYAYALAVSADARRVAVSSYGPSSQSVQVQQLDVLGKPKGKPLVFKSECGVAAAHGDGVARPGHRQGRQGCCAGHGLGAGRWLSSMTGSYFCDAFSPALHLHRMAPDMCWFRVAAGHARSGQPLAHWVQQGWQHPHSAGREQVRAGGAIAAAPCSACMPRLSHDPAWQLCAAHEASVSAGLWW
jgi:hypothetical protein